MGTELSRLPVQAESESASVEQDEASSRSPEWPAPMAQSATGAMSVGAADDPAEAAADRLADSALSRLRGGHAGHAHPGAGAPAPSGTLQRSVVPGGGLEGGVLDDRTAAEISRRSGGGRPMDEPVRRRMEGAFGQSFSSVRLHDDTAAASLSSSIQAQAFTTGNDVFLGSGIDTDTPGGERVLAHELAHVVQSGGGAAPIQRWFGKKKPVVEAPKDAPKDVLKEVAKEDPPKPKAKEKPAMRKGEEGLAEDTRKAFTAAKKHDTSGSYALTEQHVAAWVTQKQQKDITDVSSWSKRAKGDEDKRLLKDLLRAFILRQYIDIVRLKIAKPELTEAFELRALYPDEKKSMEAKYFPKTLQNRDKWKGLIDKGPYAPETQTWLEDAGFDGAIQRTPDQKASDAGGPKLDVRSTFIGGEVLGAPRRMHLFLVYTSSEGEQTYFRGGPSEDDWTECDIGPYDTDSIDWDPAAPSVTVATGEKAMKAVDKMFRVSEVINRMQVPYVGNTFKANKGGLGGLEAFMTGENCNATAWTLLEMSGVEKKKPSGVHPGWGHKLGKILSPVKAQALDLRETFDAGTPGKIAGAATDQAQVYRDRGKVEKLITLPGGSDISVVKKMDGVTRIEFGPDRTAGYVEDDKVFVPPKPGRKFWVAGAKNSIVPIFGSDGYADAGAQIEVLDDAWMPGDLGNVRVRYTDNFGTFEGTVTSAAITNQDPKAPPVGGVVDDGPDVDDGSVDDDGYESYEEVDLGSGDKRPVIREFQTDATVWMFNIDASKHALGAALGKDGRTVGATGTAHRLEDGTIMVEFVVEGEHAWMDESLWVETFGEAYPKQGD
jgi:hypothetical protein